MQAKNQRPKKTSNNSRNFIPIPKPIMKSYLNLYAVQTACFFSLFLAAANVQAEPWSPTLKTALSQKTSAPFYTYQLNFKISDMAGVLNFDPTLPAGKRAVIVAPELSKRSADFNELTKQLEQDMDKGIWCSQFSENIPASVKLISKTDDTESYQFTPLPDAKADSMEKKVMASLVGEVTVSTKNPAVLSFSMRSTQAIKPIVFVKLEKFLLNVSCERSPDGRTYAKKQISLSRGTAMGKSIDDDEEITITNLALKNK
jgi:hypothetical protein